MGRRRLPERAQARANPAGARIFTIVDEWDALRSDRPYRKRLAIQEVRDYLRGLAGSHFDPQVVAAFLEMEIEE